VEQDERGPRPALQRGRGAVRNVPGRYDRHHVEPFDEDGPAGGPDDDPPPIPTTLTPDHARSILSSNDSPDVPFERSINPYRGCEHGCTYCFARATHAYLGLSPGLDFETRLFYKPDAAALLRRELARPGYRCTPVALGANTDPYQPAERRLGLTRTILEVLAEHLHPCLVVTKSRLVLRDLDLLAPLAAERLAAVYVSITTLDPDLARSMEPRAATPARRLATVRALADAGVPTGVLVSPVVPGLTEPEIERILSAAKDAGARSASFLLLRLPHEVEDVFVDWLRAYAPGRVDKVLGAVREMYGDRLYDSTFGVRGRGSGPRAELLRRRFDVASRRLGLASARIELDTSRFRVPPRAVRQRGLFEDGGGP
jgi:DNA repair photolyase